MKIVQFTAENVKKLKVVDITPKHDFIPITGKNGSGKSSILDCIWWALAGKTAMDGQPEPIRKGQEKAHIRLDLGEMVVTRRFSKGGTTLVVENADGFRAASPQAMLDALIGHLTFDPLEFSRMPEKQQVDTLRKIANVNLDYEALAKADKVDTEARRDVGRDIKNLEGQLAGIKIEGNAPAEPVDVSALLKQLTEIEDSNSAIIEKNNLRNTRHAAWRKLGDDIKTLEAQLDAMKKKYDAEWRAIDEMPISETVDTADIRAQIASAAALNKAYEATATKAMLEKDIASKQAIYDGHTKALEGRTEQRVKAVQEAKMPIDGLSLSENEVVYNDIPFSQLSGAEQLRVSIAIAMAANPKLRVIRIKDGSLLDENGLRMVQEMAAERDYQVWCEVVNSTGKVGIFMEDGEISAINDEVA